MHHKSFWVSLVLACYLPFLSVHAQSCIDVAVPETLCATYAEVPITVSGQGNSLGTNTVLSKVEIIIEHPDIRDLNLYLEAPDGSEIALSTENGGVGNGYGDPTTCPDDPLVFADWAAESIVGTSTPFYLTGIYRPQESITTFNGLNPNGTWTLRVCDLDDVSIQAFIKYFNLAFDMPSCLTNPSLTRLYVDQQANGNNNGSTWMDAYTDLQDALTASLSCPNIEEIWVADGTYKPSRTKSGNANPISPQEKTFFLARDIKIYGGFSGMESMLSQRNPDANLTILSGDIDNNDSSNPATDISQIVGTNAESILTLEGLSANALLDGFTFTAGGNMQNGEGGAIYNFNSSVEVKDCRFVANCADEGGAIYNTSGQNVDSKPSFTDCIFEQNEAFDTGGAFAIVASSNADYSSVFTNCIFLNNLCNEAGTALSFAFAGSGGAFSGTTRTNADINPTFQNCTFENNTSGDYGGAMYFRCSDGGRTDFIINNTLFKNNEGTRGGAIYNAQSTNGGSNPDYNNCIFTGNTGTEEGGALYNITFYGTASGSSYPDLINCTFYNNTSPDGASIYFNTNSLSFAGASIVNCIFWGNNATDSGIDIDIGSSSFNNSMSYTLIQSDVCPANTTCDMGMIFNQDPLFISANDLRLQSGSPAIDQGTATGAPTEDFDGNPRPAPGTDVDMGAFEAAPAIDMTPPMITCPANVNADNDLNQCRASIDNIAATASDNVTANPTISYETTGASTKSGMGDLSGQNFQVGTTTVTYTAMDDAGNTATCSFSITVNDVQAPFAGSCSNLTRNSDPGACGTSVGFSLGGSDNCGVTGLSANPPSNSFFSVGVTQVIVTVNDQANNTATCSFNVTVNDNRAPNITCPDDINTPADFGQTSTVVNFSEQSATDNCGVQSVSSMPASGSTFNVGTSPVTYTVEDVNGNTNTCSFNVTVADNAPPTIDCPDDITVTNDAGQCSAVVNYTTPTGSDNTGVADVSCSQESGTSFDVGTTVVTCTVTDTDNNTADCTFNVTVNDNEAPTINCPANQNVDIDGTNCFAVVNNLAANANDNCSIDNTSYSTTGSTNLSGMDASGAMFNVGTTTVIYTTIDEAGRTASCSFDVIVTDNTACGCEMPQPGDMCDDGNPATIDDTVQGDCSCIGTIPCDITLAMVEVNDETCAGAEDGSITINANCTTCTGILYSIDGGATTQSSPTFTGLSPNTYQPYVVDSGDNTCNDSGMEASVNSGNALPSDPIADVASKTFCINPDLAASLTNTGIQISNSLSANERAVWVLVSSPAGSAFAANDEFTVDNCGDGFKNFGELAVANNSHVIRVQNPSNALVGTYSFDVYIENCATGCISSLTSGFSITISEAPTVSITSDPENNLCLGQEGVQYNAVLTATDGGTYNYDWCAYNASNGSGSCFNGFDDNTIQNPTRDWTSSAGAKSVGVTATSEVAGCIAEAIYNFEVIAPSMLDCPEDILTTLETNPMTFECATDITFNHPMIDAGPCGPIDLTTTIEGPELQNDPVVVNPGEAFTLTVEELGNYTVSYELTDAAGNISNCSFNVTVDGLLCGWTENEEGIGNCNGDNTAGYDPETETFTVGSNGCVPDYPYTNDNQSFINTQLCGDGYIEVFVENITNKGFAGVGLRESQAPGAKKVEIGTDKVSRVTRAVRVIDNYPAYPQELVSFDKYWLKIERTGNSFRASASTDGISYTPYLLQSIAMGECLEAGLWATSTNAEDFVTASFTNVTVVEYGSGALMANPQTQTASEAFNLRLSPNPARSEVNLYLEQLIGQEVTIELFNINGQRMNAIQLDQVEQATETIYIHDLPAGTYFISVRTAQYQQTMKFIKQ